MNEIICYCSNVSKADILKAMKNGATTLEDISRETGACTIGQCKKYNPQKRCCSRDILKILNSPQKK